MSSRSWSALVAVAVLCGLSADGSTRLVGTLEKDMSLTASGNPHVVTGTVTIPRGVSVKAGPGVVFSGVEVPRLVVARLGELRLLGEKGREIVLKGVAVRCVDGSAFLAMHCEVVKPAESVYVACGRDGKIWVRDSRFDGCRLGLGGSRSMRISSCRFDDCTFSFSSWVVGPPYHIVENCKFADCTVDLSLVVGAVRSGFRTCRFPWELKGNAVLSVHLSVPVTVRTCAFCDESWSSMKEALLRASFPRERLTVERAKSLESKAE